MGPALLRGAFFMSGVSLSETPEKERAAQKRRGEKKLEMVRKRPVITYDRPKMTLRWS